MTEDELRNNFDRVIATALHEISHKVGGDGTTAFTYALTDMMQAIVNATLKDEKTLNELRALKACWEELNAEELKELYEI